MSMRILFFIVAFVPLFSTAIEKQYYDDKERGWFWKESLPEEQEKEDNPNPIISVLEQPSPMSPREILKKQGEDWEDALAAAILDPTKENYVNYLTLTTQIMGQSQKFSDGFQKVVWVEPEYNYKLDHPVSTQAIFAKNQLTREDEDKQLKNIAQEKGILFFFKSDCPYCHRFAPVLKKFSEFYGFSVIAVSMDGKGLPDYPEFKVNQDMAQKLNVTVVPAVFLVEPSKNQISTVGYGYMDWTQLITQILFSNEQFSGANELGVMK